MLPAAAAAMKHFLALEAGRVYWFAPAFSASGKPANYGQWAVYFSWMSMRWAHITWAAAEWVVERTTLSKNSIYISRHIISTRNGAILLFFT